MGNRFKGVFGDEDRGWGISMEFAEIRFTTKPTTAPLKSIVQADKRRLRLCQLETITVDKVMKYPQKTHLGCDLLSTLHKSTAREIMQKLSSRYRVCRDIIFDLSQDVRETANFYNQRTCRGKN